MQNKVYNVLFLCTGNSARSIMAEALLSHLGRGKFGSFSAGSHPRGEIHPITIEVLKNHNLWSEQLRSKSWDEYSASGPPVMDFVITVCGQAAAESCPIWPGHPMTVHWGIANPDRKYTNKEDEYRGFLSTFQLLEQRIGKITSLPIEGMDKQSLSSYLYKIGQLPDNN